MLSNQYSLTEYYSPVQKGEVQLPAIYFLYDLSPIMVSIKDARASIAHLLVRLCAVIGGVFAITGGLLAIQAVSAPSMHAAAAVLHRHCLLQSYSLLLSGNFSVYLLPGSLFWFLHEALHEPTWPAWVHGRLSLAVHALQTLFQA